MAFDKLLPALALAAGTLGLASCGGGHQDTLLPRAAAAEHHASPSPTHAQVPTLASLAGRWQVFSAGFTGCGQTSMRLTVTLGPDGKGTDGVLQGHGQCGDSTQTALEFVILSLEPDGSGTANMSCGPSCGWNLMIQVSRDGQTFNLVDVDPVNPGNFISGMAVKRY